ncbi:sunset domain-containing protein [Bacillus thuringiensis]
MKGNANSKKYHVPGGQYYDSTKDRHQSCHFSSY